MTKFDIAVKALKEGKDHSMQVFGNSMRPLIYHGSTVTLRATNDYKAGDVVMVKINSNWLVHKITKVSADGRYMIANNRGRENGWTKQIHGRVIKVNDSCFGREVEMKVKMNKGNKKKTFFTSDTHFGHKNIIKYCKRPWENDVRGMNASLIERWNSVVSPGDEVWHLGDFCMGGTQPKDWLPRLNGIIHLVRGNHDPHIEGQGFASVQNYKELKIEGKRITLLHYPMRTWNGSHKGTWHLFGHVHGTMTVQHGRKGLKDAMAIDVGVDCHDYTPVSFEQVSKMMREHSNYLKDYFMKNQGEELSNKERKLRNRMSRSTDGRAKDPYKRGRKAVR